MTTVFTTSTGDIIKVLTNSVNEDISWFVNNKFLSYYKRKESEISYHRRLRYNVSVSRGVLDNSLSVPKYTN